MQKRIGAAEEVATDGKSSKVNSDRSCLSDFQYRSYRLQSATITGSPSWLKQLEDTKSLLILILGGNSVVDTSFHFPSSRQ